MILIWMAGMVVASKICESSTSPPAGDSASPHGTGMRVLSVAAVGMAKAPSVEEPAAAAQAFNKALRKGRLMKGLIAGRSLGTLFLMVGGR